MVDHKRLIRMFFNNDFIIDRGMENGQSNESICSMDDHGPVAPPRKVS